MVQIIRYVLGIILIISGMIKLNDPLGFMYKLEEYFEADVLNIPFMIPLAGYNGFVVALIEVVLGAAIISGFKTAKALVLSLLMFVFFGFLTFYSAYFNKVTDCGCFGDAIHFTPWQSFTKDMILLLATVFLWFVKDFIIEWKNSKVLVVGVAIFGSVLALYSVINIPIIDFRPYKIGADINAGMKMPEGAARDVFNDIWKYKVDGVVANYSTKDEPWKIKGAEFVSRETILISKGYEPPIHDFALIKGDEDYTQSILDLDDVYMVFSLDVTKIDDIKNLKEFIADNKAILITPSANEDVLKLKQKMVIEFDSYSIDNITCKTVIRHNPGVLRLKKGVVVEKFIL